MCDDDEEDDDENDVDEGDHGYMGILTGHTGAKLVWKL